MNDTENLIMEWEKFEQSIVMTNETKKKIWYRMTRENNLRWKNLIEQEPVLTFEIWSDGFFLSWYSLTK